MTTEYLGTVTGIIAAEDLFTLTGVTMGTIAYSGDITWLKFKVDNKILLVASKGIKNTISWNTLNSSDVVFGKGVIIKDTKYKCRLLTGATSNPPGSAGGEWDLLLVPNISNFPTNDLVSIYTICQETTSDNHIVTRGNNSNISYYSINSSNTTTGVAVAWRPVLEVVNAPTISLSNENLGDKLNSFSKSYSVTDADNDTFSLTEKLDGIAIRTLTNQTSGTNYTLDLSSQWDSLSYGSHTIEVTVDDGKLLGQSTVTITFIKIKSPVTTIPTNSNLPQVVSHNKELEKEISYQNFRLGEKLKDKGVSVLENESLSSLISKVRVFGFPSWFEGGNMWVTAKSSNIARGYPASSVVNGKFYVIGGEKVSGFYNDNECYDPATNTWSTKASMPTGRANLSSALVDNKIYVIGGKNALTINECYDTINNTWSTKASMPTGRRNLGLSQIDGKIYATGGATNNFESYYTANECYDPVTNTWSTKASMLGTRYGFGSSVVNGKIYCLGGGIPSGSTATANECYDPVTNTWSTKASIPTNRIYLSSSVVNGKIYCLGGLNGSSANECYDPVTNTWSIKAILPTIRYGAVSEVINNNIYVMSGLTGVSSYLTTNECYIV